MHSNRFNSNMQSKLSIVKKRLSYILYFGYRFALNNPSCTPNFNNLDTYLSLFYIYLTRNPNKRQTGPYGHIGGSMSNMPKFIHYCPLLVTNNYFHSTQTTVDSRGLQSWKIGWLWQAVQTFARYLDEQIGQIPVGTSLADHHELNPEWISSYRPLQSWLSEPLQNDQKCTNLKSKPKLSGSKYITFSSFWRRFLMQQVSSDRKNWFPIWSIFGHFEGVHSISSWAACRKRFTLDSIHGGQQGLSRPEFVQFVHLST